MVSSATSIEMPLSGRRCRLESTLALGWLSCGRDDGGVDEDHPMHRAERGEIELAEFIRLAEEAAPGAAFMWDPASPGCIMRFVTPSAVWAEIAVATRHRGIRIGMLTNTLNGVSEADIQILNPNQFARARAFPETTFCSLMFSERGSPARPVPLLQRPSTWSQLGFSSSGRETGTARQLRRWG